MMKRWYAVVLTGLGVLGAQCDRTTRPPAPPSGWVIPLVAPDSSGHVLELQEVTFLPSGIAVSGRFWSPSGSGAFVGTLSLEGVWKDYHPVTSLPQGTYRIVPVNTGYLVFPFSLGPPRCRVYLLGPDGTLEDSLAVEDPEGHDCVVVDAMPWSGGFLVAGTSWIGADSSTAFLAYLEQTSGTYRQVWFRRYHRNRHAYSGGGLLIPSSGGLGYLGGTGNASDADSLWIMKLTASGQVLAETTLLFGMGLVVKGENGFFLIQGPVAERTLLYFNLETFRVQWERHSVPYRMVDILPDGAFAGALVLDSVSLRYVQLDLRSGNEMSSRDLWSGIAWVSSFHTGPEGFLVGLEGSSLAYVPYAGDLPSLPEGSGQTVARSPCEPDPTSLFLWKAWSGFCLRQHRD